MKRFAVVVWWWCAASAGALTVEDWRFEQELTVDQPGLQRVEATRELLNAARPRFVDVRLVDASSREMPLLTVWPMPVAAVERTPKKFAVTLEGQTTVMEIETGLTQPVTGVVLETGATEFIKAVQVEGDQGDGAWVMLARGQPVFRQPRGPEQLQVRFEPGVWARLRLTVDDQRTLPVGFTGARLRMIRSPVPSVETAVRIVERLETADRTGLVIDLGAAQVVLGSLVLEADDPLFMRRVRVVTRQADEAGIRELPLGEGTIYRVAVEGSPVVSALTLEVEQTIPHREVVVWIENEDNPPLRVTAIKAHRRPVWLMFNADGPGSYRLLVGNSTATMPRYDLRQLASELNTARAGTPMVGRFGPNPLYRAREALPELQERGAALPVTDWMYRKPVQMARGGVQLLELDLETLARAARGFEDLRLVRDGRQIPFVLERTGIMRTIQPVVSPVEDPKRLSLSRWQLVLPKAGLPVTRLRCTSDTALFQRSVRVYEMAADARGQRNETTLGSAEWVRKPSQSSRVFTMALIRAPATDTLWLETDNGDNPAIELSGFAFDYPATRLWFKASEGTIMHLYYGNPKVVAPRYDAALIAAQMLASERTLATLGAEERLQPVGWSETLERSRSGNVLFWVALGVVALVLLAVITRLMPKAPGNESSSDQP